jgi:hypothetical protein
MADRIERLLEYILDVMQQNQTILLDILHYIRHVTSFTITQNRNSDMALLPIAPGYAPVFTATPVPAYNFQPGNLPTWTSSDTVNAPISVDATGLVATVNIPTTAVVGTNFTLSISFTNADGVVATGSIALTIVADPQPDVTSFTIAQTT